MGKRAGYLSRISLILLPALLLAGCSLPGVSCAVRPQAATTGTADQSAFELLRCRAYDGDKAAQVTLARAYETGTGLPRDMKKAVGWYKRAATPAPGSTPVYIAPVGNQKYGWTQNIQAGTAIPGDTWAEFRLGEIYLAGNGVKQSDRRARKWLRRAADHGHAPAADLLARMEAGE